MKLQKFDNPEITLSHFPAQPVIKKKERRVRQRKKVEKPPKPPVVREGLDSKGRFAKGNKLACGHRRNSVNVTRRNKKMTLHPNDFKKKVFIDVSRHFYMKALSISSKLENFHFVSPFLNEKDSEVVGESKSYEEKKKEELEKIPIEYLEGSVFMEDKDEIEIDMDDDNILKCRYRDYFLDRKLSNGWLNYDYVFKHYCNHLFISERDFIRHPKDGKKEIGENGGNEESGESSTVVVEESSLPPTMIKTLIPKEIICLKMKCKNLWGLYKKRECERRRRYRKKVSKFIEQKVTEGDLNINFKNFLEKNSESGDLVQDNGKIQKMLRQPKFLEKILGILQYSPEFMKIVTDRCENCNYLFVNVNLFWGKTLCDTCYFNPKVIIETMSEIEGNLQERVNQAKKEYSLLAGKKELNTIFCKTSESSSLSESESCVESVENEEIMDIYEFEKRLESLFQTSENEIMGESPGGSVDNEPSTLDNYLLQFEKLESVEGESPNDIPQTPMSELFLTWEEDEDDLSFISNK